MGTPWVTNTVALIGLAFGLYGFFTDKMDFGQTLELLFWAGAAVGIGRKLDRVHATNEQIKVAVDPHANLSLDDLIKQGQQ